MAQYDMTQRILDAGLTIDAVEAAAEAISKHSTYRNGDTLSGWSRSGERVVEQAIETLIKRREADERDAAGIKSVTWVNHTWSVLAPGHRIPRRYSEWCVKGHDLVEGELVTAVRRDGQTQQVYVVRIVGTAADGQQIATQSTTKEA